MELLCYNQYIIRTFRYKHSNGWVSVQVYPCRTVLWDLYWLFLQSVTQAAAPVGKGDKKGAQGNVGGVNTSKTAQSLPPVHSAHSLCSGVSMSLWTHFTAHVVPPRLHPFLFLFPVCYISYTSVPFLFWTVIFFMNDFFY